MNYGMKLTIESLLIALLLTNGPAHASANNTGDTQTKEGIYNYIADAALFRDCKDNKTYPVAMAGDNLALEQRYSELKTRDNEKIWIRIRGRVVEQAAMEGDRTELALFVDEFIDMDKNKSCDKDAEPALTNTAWHLIEVVWTAVPGDTQLEKAELNFSTDGRLSGSTGCNRLNGSYALNDGSLRFGPIMTTRRACSGSQGELEVAVEAALSAVDGFEIRDGILHLWKAGVPVLRYQQQ